MIACIFSLMYPIIDLLCAQLSDDEEFLRDTLKHSIAVDPFIRRLFDMYLTISSL